MDDFYIVLPSNVRNLTGKRNASGHYFTYLPKPISLDTNTWKVAVVDISYFTTWYNITPENCTIHGRLANGVATFGDTPPSHYKTLPLLMKAINKLLKSMGQYAKFSIVSGTGRCQLTIPPGERVGLHRTVSVMLGFDSNTYGSSSDTLQKVEAIQDGDVGISLHNIYLYSDIVKTRVVGDTYAPLLRTIPANTAERGHMVHHEFLNPHYMSLETGELSVIEIKLCDDSGEVIQFDRGHVIVQLHFKQILE